MRPYIVQLQVGRLSSVLWQDNATHSLAWNFKAVNFY